MRRSAPPNAPPSPTWLPKDGFIGATDPSGRFTVYYRFGSFPRSDPYLVPLLIHDNRSGTDEVAAPGIQFACLQCDGRSYADGIWSPSGRYLSYVAGAVGKADTARLMVYDTVTKRSVRIGNDSPVIRSDQSWAPAADVLVMWQEGRAHFYDAPSASNRIVGLNVTAEGGFRAPEFLSENLVHWHVGNDESVLYDLAANKELGRWPSFSAFAVVPGTAVQLAARGSGVCGVLILHPALPAQGVCRSESAGTPSWSPSHSTLAFTRPGAGGADDLVLLDVPSLKERVITSAGRRPSTSCFGYRIEWSSNARYVLLALNYTCS